MSALSESIQDTGLDLKDATLVADVLAPQLGERVGGALGDVERGVAIVRSIYNSASAAILGATTPAAAVVAVAALAAEAYGWITRQDAKLTNENLAARATVRDRFVASYYPLGGWSSVHMSRRGSKIDGSWVGQGPDDLRVVMPKAGWNRQRMVGQYDEHYAFMAARVGRSPVLYPTWSGPPYDESGMQPDLGGSGPNAAGWREGWVFDEQVLAGFHPSAVPPYDDVLLARPNPTPPVGPWAAKYWGNAPNGGRLEDGAKFLSGYAPPPNYMYLRSWGTYPDWSWSPTPETEDACAGASALALAMLAPTPIHVAIPRSEVDACYAHFRKTLARIPLAPPGQIGPGVWIDPGTMLPVSSQAGALVVVGGGPQMRWEALRRIELAFRQWYKVRHAVLYQADLLTSDAKLAASTSRDPEMSAAVKGHPPPYRAWREDDPAGMGRIHPGQGDEGGAGKSPPGDGPGRPQGPGQIGAESESGSGSGGSGAALALLALGAVGYYYFKGRR